MPQHKKGTTDRTDVQRNPIDVKLGQQIRKLRILRGYSQDAIAKKIGITFQQLQKYERGINRVCISRLVDICNFFSIRPSYFIDTLEDLNKSSSLNEDEEDFFYEASDSNINNKELLTVVRYFKTIPSFNVRKKIINLIKSLGEKN